MAAAGDAAGFDTAAGSLTAGLPLFHTAIDKFLLKRQPVANWQQSFYRVSV
jgi:hypothetical protein